MSGRLNCISAKGGVDSPLIVTKNAVCPHALENRLVAPFLHVIASWAAGHCLVHLNLKAVCQFFPRLGLEQLVSARNILSAACFESNDSAQEHADEVIVCHVLVARDERSTLRKPVDYSHDSAITPFGWGQSMPFCFGHQ